MVVHVKYSSVLFFTFISVVIIYMSGCNAWCRFCQKYSQKYEKTRQRFVRCILMYGVRLKNMNINREKNVFALLMDFPCSNVTQG